MIQALGDGLHNKKDTHTEIGLECPPFESLYREGKKSFRIPLTLMA